jgi:hypothetical protein
MCCDSHTVLLRLREFGSKVRAGRMAGAIGLLRRSFATLGAQKSKVDDCCNTKMRRLRERRAWASQKSPTFATKGLSARRLVAGPYHAAETYHAAMPYRTAGWLGREPGGSLSPRYASFPNDRANVIYLLSLNCRFLTGVIAQSVVSQQLATSPVRRLRFVRVGYQPGLQFSIQLPPAEKSPPPASAGSGGKLRVLGEIALGPFPSAGVTYSFGAANIHSPSSAQDS